MDWQTQLPTLSQRSKYAFDNSLFFDIEFSVLDCCYGNKVTVRSNKYVLAVTSPVFAAMFYGKLAETKPTIDLPDCTKEGLQEMLRYAHCEEANLTGNNVMEVLYLAKKYMMPFLEEKCKMYLVNEVGPEDVLAVVLPEVQKTGDVDLQEHLWRIVDNDINRAISSESFLNVSLEMLYQVLKKDYLGGFREVHLFQAVDKWATKRIKEKGLVCNGKNKRSILGEKVIRRIRFPLMTKEEFADIVLPCSILNIDEVTELHNIFNGIEPVTDIFNRCKRYQSIVSKLCLWERLTHDLGWYYFGNRSQQPRNGATLVGIRLLGSQPGSIYNVQLQIYQGRDRCLVKLSSSFKTGKEKIDDLQYGLTVTLSKPVYLEENVEYTLEARIADTKLHNQEQSGMEIAWMGDIITTSVELSEPFILYYEPWMRTTVGCSFERLVVLCDSENSCMKTKRMASRVHLFYP